MKVTLEGQGEPKSIKGRQGPLLIIHVCLSFDFWLLASEPNIGGFEGFDLTNPRGQFSGEIFHLAGPKLGLGAAVCSHTILVLDLLSCRRIPRQLLVQVERGRTSWGFQQGGHTIHWGGICPSWREGILRILGSGFPLQVSWHHSWWFFGVFQWRIYLYWEWDIFPRGGRTIIWRVARSKDLAGIWGFEHLGSHCNIMIYHCVDFQSIWWPPSSGPNYLGLHSSSGAHHSVEEFRSTGFESGFGDLDTWVVLTVARSISWHISWGDWTLLAARPNYWGLQHSSRAWHLPAWGFSILTAQIYCIQSSLYIQPLEACWSILLEHFVVALLFIFLAICWAFQIDIFIVAGFSISWIKSYLGCFGLSIILHMVEVCSMVVSSCL